jgi:hypothetical protein
VDISASWAQAFIIKVASHGLMGVYENHTYILFEDMNQNVFSGDTSGLVQIVGDLIFLQKSLGS